MSVPRIGQGYDVHRLVEGRPLVLGGVTVPSERGLLGHSDADVLLHAVMDALLGAAALLLAPVFVLYSYRWAAYAVGLLIALSQRREERKRGEEEDAKRY